MRVGFDSLIFSFPFGGVGVYQMRLMRALQRAGAKVSFPAGESLEDWGPMSLGLKPSPNSDKSAIFARNMIAARNIHCDVQHVAAFWRTPSLKGKRIVLTIHDMIPERLGRRYPAVRGAHYSKSKLAKLASLIVVPTDVVRQDVLEILRPKPENVIVVPHGGADHHALVPAAAQNWSWWDEHAKRYVLIVGRRSVYKGFLKAVPALGRLLKAVESVSVVCVGGGPFDRAEMAAIAKSGMADRFQQCALTDDGLALAYRNAGAFLSVSEAEGFGLPLVEAMQFGAPAIVSDIPAFREVGANAPLFFDSADPESFISPLQSVLTDKALRASLVDKGFARGLSFTWEHTVEQMLGVYERALM